MVAAAGVDERCPICDSLAPMHDVVDFNKSCEELRGVYLPLSGEPIYFRRCAQCGFCFAPAMWRWSSETFAAKVYNQDYITVDPDYAGHRPNGMADGLLSAFPAFPPLPHLDYGGGTGLLSRKLCERGWNSRSYDPYAEPDVDPESFGRFDLISAFEVFEHVADPHAMMQTLLRLLTEDGLVVFSTLLSDEHIKPKERLTWWYAAPRNGHISLFSKRSLAILAQHYGFAFGHFSPHIHVLHRTPPAWARHLIRRS